MDYSVDLDFVFALRFARKRNRCNEFTPAGFVLFAGNSTFGIQAFANWAVERE